MRLSGLAGGLAGSALVALGFGASVVIAPPAPVMDPATASIGPLEVAEPSRPLAEAPAEGQPEALAEADTSSPGPDNASPETVVETPMVAERAPRDTGANPEFAAPPAQNPKPAVLDGMASKPPAAPKTDDPKISDPAALAFGDTPILPGKTDEARIGALPGQPMPPRDKPLPQVPAAPDAAQELAPAQDAGTADTEIAADAPRLPGTRVEGLPGQSGTTLSEAPATNAESALTALERNSSFSGAPTGSPMMAVILNDPGLPTPLRRSLAALDLPVSIALNPMDPSAPQAADIYRAAGKDVLILAGGIPAGARATDLDVTFGAYFEALPQAVAVLDLPRDGFARNSALTGNILPLVARDGHGLVSFAGGLSRVATAAQNAGVPHAEVFRVLDDEDQSPFTIRRYLDRAVFQASQIGEVIVFGDATNDTTMEALKLWRSEGRVDQVAVVPVSAILLTR